MQNNAPGLRDRQRQQTLRELHVAAVALAREGGLAAATVEAITERAGVSRRTFFNYYPTKEDALLGTAGPVVPEAALERFLTQSGDDTFGETVQLILAIVLSTRQVELSTAEHHALFAEFPSLKERLAQHLAAAEGLIGTALNERRAAETGPLVVQGDDEARALLMLATAVLRFAYEREPDNSSGPGPQAIKSAISVFRNVLQEIS
jgi:AcrR family transcriptional regulator